MPSNNPNSTPRRNPNRSDAGHEHGPERRPIGPNPQAGPIRVMNRALGAILRSPLHRIADQSFALVEFTGRTSGRRYSTPVGYRRRGDMVSFHTQAPWWKNLRGGAPIRLWLGGRAVDSTAEVVSDPAVATRELAAMFERVPRLVRLYSLRAEPDGRPNPEDLATLAQRTVVINVRIPQSAGSRDERTTTGDERLDTGHDERMDERMRGKVVMITGANGGIGKAAALALATQGATVVMVSRGRAKGESAAEEVIARSGNAAVELLVADLSSQDAVRQLARDFLARHNRLDVLVNNAGVYMPRRTWTADRLETTLATNYLAPALLTNLLLPALRAAAPARIVNVSSGAQAMGHITFGGLQGTRRYSGLRAYARSKLALVTWSYELARRLSGTGVTVNALEPGFVDTKLPGDMVPGPAWLTRPILRAMMTTPAQGARTIVMLAASPRATGYNGNFFSAKGAPIRSAAQSYDRAVARRLWDETARLIGTPVAESTAIPTR